jgi:hypothetical protein
VPFDFMTAEWLRLDAPKGGIAHLTIGCYLRDLRIGFGL